MLGAIPVRRKSRERRGIQTGGGMLWVRRRQRGCLRRHREVFMGGGFNLGGETGFFSSIHGIHA